jgi:hypothetical protein
MIERNRSRGASRLSNDNRSTEGEFRMNERHSTESRKKLEAQKESATRRESILGTEGIIRAQQSTNTLIMSCLFDIQLGLPTAEICVWN